MHLGGSVIRVRQGSKLNIVRYRQYEFFESKTGENRVYGRIVLLEEYKA